MIPLQRMGPPRRRPDPWWPLLVLIGAFLLVALSAGMSLSLLLRWFL